MLPILFLDVTDVTARAAVYEGFNDNVVETRPAPDLPSERRGSAFTGADFSVAITNLGMTSTWFLRLGARGQHYTPLSDKIVGGDDGTLALGWGGGWQLTPVSHLGVGQSVMLTDQNTARFADMPMVALDPSTGRQAFVFATNDISYRRDLSNQSRLRVTAGGALRYMLHDTAPDSRGRGIDYGGPRAESEWSRDIGPTDTGALRVHFGMWYMPRALLDLTGGRGPSETWQVTPAAVWGHELSEAWRSEIMGGASFIATKNEVFSSSSVVPALSGQLSYSEDEVFALLSYALGVNTDSMSLGPGLSHSLGAQYGGPFGRSRVARRFVAGGSARMSRATIPISSTSSFVAMTAAAGGLFRYALGDWLGIVVGYEGQYLSLGQSSDEPSASTTFYRNVVYIGVSGSASTMDGALPLDVPRPPPR